ncbi:MAG: glycosyltransferase family 9 protein, partial [Deltaproteobacteria bacterium]|nr:glycosyltransferase family 9 protein [Deltaproteobacteria bacterium]
MTTPAIGVIRRHFPNAEITILANPLVAALFSPHDWVDRVIVFDRNGRHRGIFGRLRLARELRNESFDLAIILPNSFDSALVPWLAGIPSRLGKSSDGRGLLLSERYQPDKSVVISHEVNYYLDLLRHFGICGQAGKLQLFTTADEELEAEKLLA